MTGAEQDELRCYIVVRRDLKMTRGKESAQVAHAVLGLVLPRAHKARILDWHGQGGGGKIVLSTENAESLMAIAHAAKALGEATYIVTDAGRTMFGGVPTLTCAAIGPAWSSRVRGIFEGCKLR
jgi:PTH2 family peptidyl-tRNA hydrolase